jgi:hypothetical protein
MALSATLAAGQWWRVRRAIARGEPPLITGWLPWVGAAITFGRAKPALFLRQCQDKVSSIDLFIINLLRNLLHFLTLAFYNVIYLFICSMVRCGRCMWPDAT